MKQYIDLVTKIIDKGVQKTDRTGTGTISIFGHQSEYEMSEGFPLLTLKNTWFKGVVHELIWLLGNHTKLDTYKKLPLTNIKYLVDNNVHIWDEWANEKGELGPVYGQQWTAWEKYGYRGVQNGALDCGLISQEEDYNNNHINQIQVAIDRLISNPDDRGIIVSAWNVGELKDMALRPCHTFFQFNTEPLSYEERIRWFYENNWETGMEWTITLESFKKENLDAIEWHGEILSIPKYRLSLQLYQRSADTFLGVPFNIASYSLLLHMIAQVTNMIPGKFIHSFGDAHLYLNHKDQVNEFLQRTLPSYRPKIDFWESKNSSKLVGDELGPQLPKIKLNPEIKNIFDFQFNDIELINYNPLKTISAPVAI